MLSPAPGVHMESVDASGSVWQRASENLYLIKRVQSWRDCHRATTHPLTHSHY